MRASRIDTACHRIDSLLYHPTSRSEHEESGLAFFFTPATKNPTGMKPFGPLDDQLCQLEQCQPVSFAPEVIPCS
jgi:hypothetical protein